MVRVKRGQRARKRRKKLLTFTKGFRWGRKSKYRLAKQALLKALTYAWRDRKTKKRERRRLWQTQINAACRFYGLSYSKFMASLKTQKIGLDRKILASLAQGYPEIFQKIVNQALKRPPFKKED